MYNVVAERIDPHTGKPAQERSFRATSFECRSVVTGGSVAKLWLADWRARNWCIKGARIAVSGQKSGPGGRFDDSLPRAVLCESSIPDLLKRSEVLISAAPKRELPLTNPMGKFDAGQGNGRTPEGLEAPSSHCSASAFDRSMILFNDVIEVLITSHLNVLPLRILAPQKPKGHVALQVAIERDLVRPPRQAC